MSFNNPILEPSSTIALTEQCDHIHVAQSNTLRIDHVEDWLLQV